MSEFAGVDPHRVRLLANRLKDLADALDREGTAIRANFSRWDGTLNLVQLAQQAAEVRKNAKDMSLRADLAANLLRQGNISFCGVKGDMVNVPWDTKDINTAQEAQEEAAALKKALDNPKDPASRATITEIAQSMADHQDDPAYMTSLLIHGGVNDTVRAATALHAQDGTHDGVVLNKDSEKLLAQFGQATKVMSDLAVQGKYPHPAPDYLAALTSPPGGDMWSVGMLFKYGPSGDTWNPKVLSDVGGAMLDWRAKQLSGRTSMRPDYMPRTGSAGYYGFYTSPGINNWYQSLGLDPRYTDPDGGPALVAAIEANDPSVALMNRVGENAQASRALLTQPDGAGLRHAEQLVDYQWQTPGAHGPHDESDPIRRVLTLAATDRSAANQDQSGIAADNILTAAAKEQGIFAGRDDSDKKEQYQTYPQGTAVALAAITATWAKDLGATSLTATDGTHGYDLRDHVLVSNATDLTKAMQLFAKDNPGAAAMFDVTLHEQVSEAAGSKDATDQLTNMGNLAGLFTKAKVGNKYTQAQQLDEKHKFNTYLLTTAGSLFGYIPAPTAAAGETLSKGMEAAAKGLKYSQNLVTLGRTVTAPQTDPFSVDNAGKQEKVNEAEAKQEYRSFSASIVQGLIRSGQIPPPTNRPWYNAQTGTLAPHAVDDPDFQGWWSNTQGRADYLNDFKSGFDTGEVSPDGR